MKLTTTCNHCNGTGTVEVTGVYLETLHGLQRLTKAHGYTTAAKSAEWFGCSATALNNRLAWLERHGFASSTKFGRERRYSA